MCAEPPEQLGHKKKVAKVLNSGNIVNEAIRSGEVSKTVNPDKQRRHTQAEHLPGRSYIYGDSKYAQELVDKLSGTGKVIIPKNGKWNHKERVTNSENIGVLVDQKTGQETVTKCGMIVYSNTGTHIYPRRKGEDEDD